MENILYKIRKYTHKYATSRAYPQKRIEYIRHQQNHFKNLLHTITQNMSGGADLEDAASVLKATREALVAKKAAEKKAAEERAAAAAVIAAAASEKARDDAAKLATVRDAAKKKKAEEKKAAADAAAAKLTNLEDEKNRLEAALATLTDELSTLRADKDSSFSTLTAEKTALVAKIAELNAIITALQTGLADEKTASVAASAASATALSALAAEKDAALATSTEKIDKLTKQITDATANYNIQYKVALHIIAEYVLMMKENDLTFDSDTFYTTLKLTPNVKDYVKGIVDGGIPAFDSLSKKASDWTET
jgi:chromosome segregation ATPase